MVHADHRRHHRQVLADERGLILLTGATGYIGSRLLRELEAGGCNRRLNERGVGVMTTAVLATYYPPRRRLTVSYAGHPTGWLFRADTGAWARLCEPAPPPQKRTRDLLLAEFVEGPPGPALWHVFKHRLLRQERW